MPSPALNEEIVETLKSSVDAGVKRLGMCNALYPPTLQTLIDEINAAFAKAARNGHKSGTTTL